MIERTYSHLARGSEELAVARLDAYRAAAYGQLGVEQA